jgi:PAS domain-containing protein
VGLTWSLLRQGLLTVVPIAQESVLQNLHDAVLVLDSANRVALANRAFFDWLGIHDRGIVGLPVSEVLGAWPALQSTLGLDYYVCGFGQRIVVLLQIDSRPQQRVELAGAKVSLEVNKPRH